MFKLAVCCAVSFLLVAATSVCAQPASSRRTTQNALETIVVTASRRRQTLVDAPAAVTVISGGEIARLPWDDYGDLLRNVPGVNVAQTSARDVNVTARGATSTLSTSQLLLLDGRSLYLDFFGFVMWDLLPVQPSEIERIEVVRGPGSAVWGANAMTGVVNVITKRPKQMLGTTLVVGTPYAGFVHAGANGAFSYRISAGYFRQRAYQRPTGVIPGSDPPQVFPSFDNAGTHQSRADFRLDWDTARRGRVSLTGGYAGTDGILHSGIGPFRIGHGSGLSYVQADWNAGSRHLGFFGNFLRGEATNLLTLGSTGEPLAFDFVTDTYELNYSDTSGVGARHTLTYGGDYRSDAFRLGLAPAARGRGEWGGFMQDDIALGKAVSWVVGARYDRLDPLPRAVLTPRTSLSLEVSPRHTLRFSYNEAFRTPSVVDDDLDTGILERLGPYLVPAAAVGNRSLSEERMKAYEVGYVGTFDNGTVFTASVYRNLIENSIDFFTRDRYGPGHLPTPSPMLPAAVVPCFEFAPGTGPAACPARGLAGVLPSDYSYRNVGRTVDRGVELALQRRLPHWRWFANLSWQDRPRIGAGVDPAGLNVAPEWRGNVGLTQDAGKRFWTVTVNYQSKAYWADVLYARGTTAPFRQVDADVGWRLLGERLRVEASAQNLFDAKIQQHIFGDILGRRLEAEVSYSF